MLKWHILRCAVVAFTLKPPYVFKLILRGEEAFVGVRDIHPRFHNILSIFILGSKHNECSFPLFENIS